MTSELKRLCDIMTTLRADGGCGWDRKQTLSSLKRYLIEETYETIDAIDDVEREASPQNINEHKEELGDLLFQIVFQSEIQRERGAFSMNDVCQAISEKLIRRHPHIFADESKDSSDENPHWERIKELEREQKGVERMSVLDGIPKSMPALLRAMHLSQKAASVGFDWPDYVGARAKLSEELTELDDAILSRDRSELEHELGDVMFSCVNLARHLQLDPESTLKKASVRFETRFRCMEKSLHTAGATLSQMDAETMEEHWQVAKQETRSIT